MDGTWNILVARIAQAMSVPGEVPKNQSRAKRFDKAPRFTLKTGFQFRFAIN